MKTQWEIFAKGIGEPCFVIHYGEVGLKGENRSFFEGQLMKNIKTAIEDISKTSILKYHGRFILPLPSPELMEPIQERLARVFGIVYFAPALLVAQDIEHIEAAARHLMANLTFSSFAIKTRRAQKRFPMSSQEVNIRVGAAVQQQSGARVDLSNPDVTCYIEIFDNKALVYAQKIPAAGGLPVGVSERAVSLLSAGIDSPVASYKIMKRGVKLIFVHFHSVPLTSSASIENATKQVEFLTQFQYHSKLYLVPFLEVQQQIMAHAPKDYRVVLYRRFMLRLAEKIAYRERAKALVTGESIAQVASQTLSNMQVINEVATLPVLRPLAGDDKEEIIQQAKTIGTFHVSIDPYEDCCSLFIPKHPVTRAKREVVLEAESKLDMDNLLKEALSKTEVLKFHFPKTEQGEAL